MKKFKKLATLGLALMLSFGFGAMASSCFGDGSESSSSTSEASKTYTAYEFVVKNADGSAATGYVQLCIGTNTCYNPVAVDAEGKVTYNPDSFPGAGVYDIHFLNASYAQVSFDGPSQTAATYGEYVLTLK